MPSIRERLGEHFGSTIGLVINVQQTLIGNRVKNGYNI